MGVLSCGFVFFFNETFATLIIGYNKKISHLTVLLSLPLPFFPRGLKSLLGGFIAWNITGIWSSHQRKDIVFLGPPSSPPLYNSFRGIRSISSYLDLENKSEPAAVNGYCFYMHGSSPKYNCSPLVLHTMQTNSKELSEPLTAFILQVDR